MTWRHTSAVGFVSSLEWPWGRSQEHWGLVPAGCSPWLSSEFRGPSSPQDQQPLSQSGSLRLRPAHDLSFPFTVQDLDCYTTVAQLCPYEKPGTHCPR